jgi:hypothetical protein
MAQKLLQCLLIFDSVAGDAAILNDGEDSSTHKNSLYIPWLRKTKYLAVESLVQKRSESTGAFRLCIHCCPFYRLLTPAH